jgi:hypothetical protein
VNLHHRCSTCSTTLQKRASFWENLFRPNFGLANTFVDPRRAMVGHRIRTGIALLILSHGLVGCADQGSPTAPSAPAPSSVQQPTPQPTGAHPGITAIAPQVGSTRGGAWATITGTDFQRGATVRLGDSAVTAWVPDSATITIWTTAHTAGRVDVIVTNPGGLQATLTGGYAYEPPVSFDFNGDWRAYAGPEYETDMRFTIRNNVLVSASCGMSAPLTFEPPPSVLSGEFSFLGDDGLAITGLLVSPVNAVGTINVPGCPTTKWWADKSSDAVARTRVADARVSLREIDDDDVRILPDTIEHDRFPVRHDVERPYSAAIAKMGELTCGLRRQIEQPEVR